MLNVNLTNKGKDVGIQKHKLNMDGTLHLIVPIVVLVVVAAAGAYLTVKGHASPSCGPSGADWSTSSKTGSYNTGSYAFHNNEWGAVSGSQQTMWVNTVGSWGVCAYQPNPPSSVKSYPEAQREVGKTIGSLSTAYVDVNYNVPSKGTWDAAADTWIDGHPGDAGVKEVMFWTYNHYSTPAGSKVATYTFGGATWNVWVDGSKKIYTFERQTNDASTRIYLRAGYDWLVSHGYLKTSDTFTEFNWGYEIVGTGGGTENFTTTGLSWDVE